MLTNKKRNIRNRLIFNAILFFLSSIYIFIIGVLPQGNLQNLLYAIVITTIFILTVFTIKGKSNFYIYFVVITIFILWLSNILNLKLIGNISGIITILFFISAITSLIIRIAKSKSVSALEFIEAINIYLLLGIIGSILFRLIYTFDTQSFISINNNSLKVFDFIYYSFVTLSTLGYGDISPVHPMARSVAMFISITGQLYLTMIVALLVGKYIGKKNRL